MYFLLKKNLLEKYSNEMQSSTLQIIGQESSERINNLNDGKHLRINVVSFYFQRWLKLLITKMTIQIIIGDISSIMTFAD